MHTKERSTHKTDGLPLYSVAAYELVNVSGGSCRGCGEQFSLSKNIHNTDVKYRLVLTCTHCGDLALFDVLPD